MLTISEIRRIERRRTITNSTAPRPEITLDDLDLFAEPNGIQIRAIEDPKTGLKILVQALSNKKTLPTELENKYAGVNLPPYLIFSRAHTPLPPNYFTA